MSQNQEQTDSQRKFKTVNKSLGSYLTIEELNATVDSYKEQFPEAHTFEFTADDDYGSYTISLSFLRYETEKEKEDRIQKENLSRKRQEEYDRLKYEELKRKFENG